MWKVRRFYFRKLKREMGETETFVFQEVKGSEETNGESEAFF